MENETYLQRLLSQVPMDSILVIDHRGNIRRIYCPFRVRSMAEFPAIRHGEIVFVEKIGITTNLKDVYFISRKPYYSIYFIVLH